MRLAIVAVVAALGCGGARSVSEGRAPAEVEGLPATRWVAAKPTFMLAAPTVRQAQRSLRDVIESFGMLVGVDVADASRGLQQLLAIDPLSPDARVAAGIDLEGSLVVFSEDVAPTFVVRLADPAATQAFFDRQRERGLVTQSVVVEGVEVFTAQLLARLRVSWAIADDWLWVHFAPQAIRDDAATWFANSRSTQPPARRPAWRADWAWATGASRATDRPGLHGFVDAGALLAMAGSKLPALARCVQIVAPVRRVAIAVAADGPQARGSLTLDVGDAAKDIAGALMPVPEGFAAASAQAPLAVQWNLDLLAVRAWLHPCLAVLGEDLHELDRLGVRAGRAVLQRFDPDDKSGAGAVSLDLAHAKYFGARLDDIPMRGTLERDRMFGPHAGHSISIPFVATLDYVLTDRLALAGVGDGLLAKVIGTGATVPGPLLAVDVTPPAMSADAWRAMLSLVVGHRADLFVTRMMRWKEGHLRVTVEGSSLVLSATGTRR